jgi:hypothetical protein
MIVVADAGPIHYLVLIEAVAVLEPLYARVLVPESVALELRSPNTPPIARDWICAPPSYCEIPPDRCQILLSRSSGLASKRL